MTTVLVEPLTDVQLIEMLAADAENDGHRMVSHLIAEWRSGENRYSLPGERLYVATLDRRVVGVCGLNVDPYANDPSVGRVRRLYVAVADRRHRIGRTLVERIVDDARDTFARLRLRTFNPVADAFYRSCGFVAVAGDEHATHERRLR